MPQIPGAVGGDLRHQEVSQQNVYDQRTSLYNEQEPQHITRARTRSFPWS